MLTRHLPQFSKETDTTQTTPRVDGSAGYTLRDGPIRSPSTSTTPTTTRTGWCGYLAGALFLLLITSLLTIIREYCALLSLVRETK